MDRYEVVLGKSRLLTFFFASIYIGAGAIISWLPVSILFKIIGICLLSSQCRSNLRRYARRTSKDAIVRLWQEPNGDWGCQTRSGRLAKGSLKGDSFKSRWFFILRLGLKQRSINVMVPLDAVNSSEYRLLSNRFHFLK